MDIKGLKRQDSIRQLLNYNDYVKYIEEEKKKKEIEAAKKKKEQELVKLQDSEKPLEVKAPEKDEKSSVQNYDKSTLDTLQNSRYPVYGKDGQLKDSLKTSDEDRVQQAPVQPKKTEDNPQYYPEEDSDSSWMVDAINYIKDWVDPKDIYEAAETGWKYVSKLLNYGTNPLEYLKGVAKSASLSAIPVVGPGLSMKSWGDTVIEGADVTRKSIKMSEYLDNDDWVHDAFAKYVQGKNRVEVETDAGNIVRNEEKRQYLQTIEQYNQLILNHINLINSGADLKTIDESLKQIEKLKEQADIAGTYLDDDEVDRVLIYGDNFVRRAPLSEKAMMYAQLSSRLLGEYLKNSYTELDSENKDYAARAYKNLNELEFWKQFHTVSPEFEKKEQDAQANLLSDLDTYCYSMPGVMGSSASFNGIQLLGTALNWVGQGVSMIKNPYTAAAGLALIGAGAVANIAAGDYENSAEVASNYKEGFKKTLQKRGLYDEFIKEGKQQLGEKGITYEDEDDIFTKFMLKDWMPDNPKIRNAAVDHLYGAQNLWKSDMMAVSADVVLDTSLSIFAPYGPMSKFGRKFALPKADVLKRYLEIKGHGTIAQAVANFAKETGPGRSMADAMSPVLGLSYRTGRAVLTPITKPLSKAATPFVKKMASKLDDIVGWSKVMPDKLFAEQTIGKNLVDFAGRTLVRGFSEAVEEGKQHEYGERYANGLFAGKSRTMLDVLTDDLSTGTNVGLLFLGHQLLGLEADEKLMAEMRGGFLGGLLNQNTLISTYHAISQTVRKVNAGDAIIENLIALKSEDRSSLINAENYAKYNTASDFDRMMKAFDEIEEQQAKIIDITGHGFTKEDIDIQREEYKRVYKLANSKMMLEIAKQRGITPKNMTTFTEDYRTFVAIANYLMNKSEDAKQLVQSDIEAVNKILEDNGLLSQKEFENIEEILKNEEVRNKLSDSKKKYLSEIELSIGRPEEINEEYIKKVKNQLAFDVQFPTRIAQYAAVKLLLKEYEAMEDLSPEEASKHREKAQMLRQMVKTFRQDPRNAKITEELEKQEFDMDEIRNAFEDVLLFDLLAESYRLYAYHTIQQNQADQTLEDFLGKNEAEEIALRLNGLGRAVEVAKVFNNDYINNEDIKEFLKDVQDTNLRQRATARKKFITRDLIERYKESKKKDEDLQLRINRDFRLHVAELAEQHQINLEDEQQQQEKEEISDNIASFAAQSMKDDVDDYIRNAPKSKRELIQDELFDADEDGVTAWENINNLFLEGAKLYKNNRTSMTIDDGTGKAINIPIDKKYTHYAVREDGSIVYLTTELANYLSHLYGPSASKPKISLYVSPEVTITSYEDELFDAVMSQDKDLFDSLIQKYQQYLSQERIDFLNGLWNDVYKGGTDIVPVEGTHKTHKTDSQIREEQEELDRAIRKAANSIFSLITILGNYTNLLPTTDEEKAEYLDKLNEDLNAFLSTKDKKAVNAIKGLLGKKNEYNVTAQQIVDLYVRAGFNIITEKKKGSVKYYAESPTGERYPINKTQYEYASWVTYYKGHNAEIKDPVESPIDHTEQTPTDKQKAVIELLKQKLADDIKRVRNDLRTGLDYFFVEDGKLVRYSRVHSQLKGQYQEFKGHAKSRMELVSLLNYLFDDKQAFKDRVIELEKQYNDELKRVYGEDSQVYKNNKISLQQYLLDDIINDRGIIDSIAQIAHIPYNRHGEYELDVINRAVIAGTIIDEICRDFFAGKTVINKDEYKMPQKFFDKLILDLTRQKELYESRGWYLMTDPFCWKAVVDGVRVAGETDMIGIDKEGNIHIIDFKTSKYSFEPETEQIIPSTVSESQTQNNQFIPALDQLNLRAGQQRTARQSYTDQLTYYMKMIHADLLGQVRIDSAELLTFQIRTRAGKNALGEYDESVFDGFVEEGVELNSKDDTNPKVTGSGVKFAGSVSLQFSPDITRKDFKNSTLAPLIEVFNGTRQNEITLYNEVLQLVDNNSHKISDKSKVELESIRKAALDIEDRITRNNLLSDQESIKNITSEIQNIISRLEELRDRINEEILKYDEDHKQPVPRERKLNPNRKTSLGMSQQFNCLDIFNENYVPADLKRVSALPDFMMSAEFEIDVDTYEKTRVYGGNRIATPTVYVTIRYTEHTADGRVKKHVFDKVKLLPARQNEYGQNYDSDLNGNKPSPLLAKIESLIADPENKGKKIILTGGNRTNGIVKYEGNDQAKTVQDAFGISDEDMENAVYDTPRGVMGITKRGNVYRILSQRGELVPLHGESPDRALTNGLPTWYMNLGYEEDNGSKAHSIPIALTPRALLKTDIDFIIDLLRNFKGKRKIKINGKEYDCPISNSRLLRTIIRFGAGAEETDNRFIFDWAEKNEQGFSLDSYRTVRIALKKKDEEGFEFDEVIDITTEDGVNRLRDILSKQYIYANNEYAMVHASVAARDASSSNEAAPLTNPFVGIEKFFKSHPELTTDTEDTVIEFSESFKFRRSDVDPDLDGSYKGITGLHWMMKNGWLRTNFKEVILPMISFNDVEVVQETQPIEEQKVEDGSVKPEETEHEFNLPWNDYEFEAKILLKPAEKPLDKEQATKRLRKILGSSFSIEFLDKALDVLRPGMVGMCRRDAIILSTYAENGTEFHEAFHAVVDLLIGENRRKRIYKIYNHKYGGDKLSEQEIAEGLADLYMEFRQNSVVQWDGSIASLIKQVYNWVRQLYNLDDARLAWLFIQTNAGIFRNRVPSKESIEWFKRVTKGRGYEPYIIRDFRDQEIELKRFNSLREINDALDSIVYRLVHDFGIDNIATNLENLKTDKKSITAEDSRFRLTYLDYTQLNLSDENIDRAIKIGRITEADKDKILKYREIFENWDKLHPFILEKLKEIGVDSVKRRKLRDKAEKDGGTTNAVSDDIEGHSDAFYEHSRSEDVSAKVRFFLSTVPSVRWVTEEDIAAEKTNARGEVYTSIYRKDKKGNIVYDASGRPERVTTATSRNSLGEISYQSFKEVYQKLLRQLYNVENVTDLINRLDKLGQDDYVFYHVKKALYNFRWRSYLRDENGIPIVMYKGKKVLPKEYISDPNNLTEEEKFPTVVRYTHDVIDEDTGKIIHHAGDIMQGAVILTNAEYEAITTQLFQAIKSQHLDFTFTYASTVVGEDGQIEHGKHKYHNASTNTETDSRIYPLIWFNRLRQSSFGLFEQVDGETKVNKNSYNSRVFENTRQTLLSIQAGLAPNLRNRMRLGNKVYNFDNDEDFDKIETLFISALNRVGIMIDKPALNYMLMLNNPDGKLQDAFAYMFTTNEETSINQFIKDGGVLDKLQKAFNEGYVLMFTEDVNTNENKKAQIKAVRTGSYMYSLNGFVIAMATGYSKYRSFYQESRVLGPDNTMMYTFAENHTASDTTYELNNVLDEYGNVRSGNIMEDLKKSVYVMIERDNERIGSLIAKNVLDPRFNPSRNKIVLHTHSGLRLLDSRDGGTKYSEITAIEDYISKAQILRDGNIVFPTLSDKSTWFYLSGIKLPGFNWSAKSVEEFGLIPVVGKSGRIFYTDDDRVGDFKYNPAIDQLLEYAYCELANIEKTIDELGLNDDQLSSSSSVIDENTKVKNYHTKGKANKKGNYKDAGMHGARFTVLTGVYDERTGKYIEFNKVIKSDPDLGVKKCYELAKQYFFDKAMNPKTGQLETDEELRCRQRSQIASILQHRIDEELDNLVDKGILEFDPRLTGFTVSDPSKGTTLKANLSRYFGYVNKYLDDGDISYLAGIYKAKFRGKYSDDQCRSLAITAYVGDIVAKSIISMEETERIFTGMPQFFKHEYDEDGHLVDRGSDESKRYGGEGSTGTNNRDDLPNISSEYTCAEIKDWEIKSSLSETLGKAFREDEYREALANKLIDELKSKGTWSIAAEEAIYDDVYSREFEKVISEFSESERKILDTKIKAEVGSFEKGINVADGTAYISDRMAENLLRQRGAYGDEVQKAFEYLRGNDKSSYLSNEKAYTVIYKALISTQKYSAFGFRMENDTPVHFYDKFALFPLFKGIAYGFTQNLYDKMNDPENPVDMVMFDSAVKSGSEGALEFNPDTFRVDDDPSNEDNFIDGDVGGQNWKPSIKNFSFKGHIYKQKYKFIRRQLNTDPRTDEDMAFGTLVLKIALSTIRLGQTYTLPDGSTMRGDEVRDAIMGYQRVLADRGAKKILDEFFDGEQVSIEKLAQFIKEQLIGRQANKNLIDATKIFNGNFDIDLNAVSEMGWAESIINSHINSEVIDITMPGNAYYQRSVFGMEGKTIMSDEEAGESYTINDGKPLLMINEDGSMDAVISIDYFMHLIPKDIRYNFEKARQFLIDNRIIGPNAETNTISYRIPTQAISSIHALKFVDVLPIVRDTIVLPKEFTKITGSDFDIDKLYLTTINYKLDNKARKITKDFKEDSNELLQNNMMRCYLGLLCDAGKLVNNGEISMSRYMHMLHRSIDNDTSLIHDVLDKIEAGQEKSPYEPYQYSSLSRQVNIKNAFITGKMGIGPFALNNNNHIFTMLYNVSFAESEDGSSILDVLNMRSLGRSNDRDGNSILSWISAMINAHVDAAKDPFILRLNVNKYTYNLTNLLLRLGFGDDALYFLSQPILKDLAKVYENANGSINEDPGLSATQRYKQAEAMYVTGAFRHSDVVIQENIMSHVGNNLPDTMRNRKVKGEKEKAANFDLNSHDIWKALFAVGQDGKYSRKFTTVDGVEHTGSILEDLVTNPEARIDPSKPASMNNLSTEPRYLIGEQKISPMEMQAFIFTAKLQLDQYAEAMSDMVQHTKIDTKKQGISFTEHRSYRLAYDTMHDAFERARSEQKNNPGTIVKPNSMFDENLERMLDDSFIHRKTIYGTSLLRAILGKFMIGMSDNFQNILDKLCFDLGVYRDDVRTSLSRALLTYVKQKCMNQCMADKNIDFKSMIKGHNTLASRIDALKEKMVSDKTGKYSDFVLNGVITNKILESLLTVPYVPQYGQERYDVVTLNNIQSDDKLTENDYIDSWQMLLDSEDEEIRQIGNDLAIYAFMTSGDNHGFTKFFKYVPNRWKKSFGYADYMRRMSQAFQNGLVTLDGEDGFFNIDSDELIRNNWTNDKIVPVMSPYYKQYKSREEMYETGSTVPYRFVKNYVGHLIVYRDINPLSQEIDNTADQVIAAVVPYKQSYKVTVSKSRVTGEFPRYIKMRRRNSSPRSADPYMLYKLVTTAKRTDEKGNIKEYPVYALTYPGGYSIKALSQRFDFYEYERDDNYTHIFSRDAMLGDNYGDHLLEMSVELQEYMNKFGVLPKSLTDILDDEEFIETDNHGNHVYNLGYDQVVRDLFDMIRNIDEFAEATKNLGRETELENESQEVGEENVKGTIESMESNNNPEFTEADKNIKLVIGNSPLKVVMASEHTDPVPNSKKVCLIINEDRKLPKEQRKYHMLQIMTKHDGLPLLDMLELDIPKTVHFSITGLGGTKWEPGVMKPDDLLDRIEDLIKQNKLNPALVTIRIDPIVPGVTTPNMIKHIIERSLKMGIKSFKISIMDSYSYNDSEKWRRGVYEKMTKLGYDFSKYYTKYSNGNFSQDVKPELMKSIYEKVDEIAQQYGVRISTCGEKPANVDVKNISFALGCLNAHTVAKVLGTTEQEVNKASEESQQRPGKCHCLNNKIDILSFDDTCFSSCAYCYARHGSDSAYRYYNEDGTLKQNGLTMTRRLENSNTESINLNNTAQFGVVLTNGSRELKDTYQKWQEDNPNGIVAYRINFRLYNTPEEVLKGHIGNPFSENRNGEETVKQFYTWIVKGTNFGNPKATEDFRLAIIQKLLLTPEGSPVLYYKELGRPSHATVIGYLINHKELLQKLEEQSYNIETEEFYSKVAVDSYINDLVNIEGISKDDITVTHTPETETEDEYWIVSVKRKLQNEDQKFNDPNEYPEDEMKHCKND